MHTEHEGFMATALEEAKRARDLGNAAVGAVIVRDGELLSTGCNEVTSSFDITAHAEAAAIQGPNVALLNWNQASGTFLPGGSNKPILEPLLNRHLAHGFAEVGSAFRQLISA